MRSSSALLSAIVASLSFVVSDNATGAEKTSATKADPPDLVAYIAEVRAAGATEQARANLQTVASIIAGTTILEFPKDPVSGDYGNSYRSTACPKPGMSAQELAAMRKEVSDREAPVLTALRSAADADHSGFISTAEGWALRSNFEFGAKLAFLEEQESTDREHLQNLLHVSPADFDSGVTSYAALVESLHGVPVEYLPSLHREKSE